MSLPTVLRPAKATDCDDIYQAHLYAVRYTCSSTYNETILTAWSALLSPTQDKCGAAGILTSLSSCNTVLIVRSRVEPPAPYVQEKKSGL